MGYEREVFRIVDRVLSFGRSSLAASIIKEEEESEERFKLLVDRIRDFVKQRGIFLKGSDVGVPQLEVVSDVVYTPKGDVVVSGSEGMQVVGASVVYGIARYLEDNYGFRV